jgi:hypothetical protein
MGMFDSLKQPTVRDQLADERLDYDRNRFMAQDPFQAGAMGAYESYDMAGKELGRAVTGLAGRDPRTQAERRNDAVAKAREEIAAMGEVDLSTPEGRRAYGKQMQEILRRNDMPVEAHEAAQAQIDAEDKAQKMQIQQDAITQKREAEATKAANVAEANRIKAKRNDELAKLNEPEITRLIEAAEKMPAGPMRAALVTRINGMANGKLTVTDAGGELIVRNQAGDILGTDYKTEDPNGPGARAKAKSADAQKQALANSAEYMAGLQDRYNTAVQLYNHRGLPGITGSFNRWMGEDEAGWLSKLYTVGVSAAEGRSALALYGKLRGGAFLAGLEKLKRASKTGASGLGAVSEKEGDKVENDAVALNRYPEPQDFRATLKAYINFLEAHAHRAIAAAQQDAADLGVPAPALGFKEYELVTPKGQKGKVSVPTLREKAPAPGAAAPAPSAPAAGGPTPGTTPGGAVWERGADGKLRRKQ